MKKEELQPMREYKWDEDFYKEIIKDHNFRYGKFNPLNYPIITNNEQP